MSGKQWLSLLILFIGYVLLGASLFWHIELQLEVQRREEQLQEEEEIYALLVNNFNSSEGSLEDLLEKLETYCGKAFSSDPDDPEPFKWHFYNAVFFVITVVSTIGYGNLAPTCMLSRLLMIAFALIGIPLNGILLTHMANFFGHFFLIAHEKYKMHRIENKMGLVGNILLYLIPGFLVFIMCPSFLFSLVEGWSFDESVYYAFVSLTTIGFGDYVAGQGDEAGALYSLYKAFLILWLVFGLGYLVMILGFITRALRSKRMARLEHKLSRNIKHTQNKIWNGFVSEVGFFRRALNELYLMKLKPVYHDDDASLATLQLPIRSASCPDLYLFMGAGPGSRKASRAFRPRAFSEALPGQPLLARRRSETELAKIDRRATFADTSAPGDSVLDPAELLHEFMNALVNWGGVGGAEDVYDTMYKQGPGTAIPGGGYLGFPDADILSTERRSSMIPPSGLRPRVSTPSPAGLSVPGLSVNLGTRARARAMSLAPFSAAAGVLAEQRARLARQARPSDAGLGSGVQQDGHESDESTLPADELPAMDNTPYNAEWTWSGAAASRRVHELIRARQSRRRSEAPVRTTRSDRKLQDLHQFQHQQYLEQLQQAAKERRQMQRRLEMRSKSTSAADPDAAGQTLPLPAAPPGLMRRLKDFARRGSLQPPSTELSYLAAVPAQQRSVTSGDSFPSLGSGAAPLLRHRTQSASERRASVLSMRRDSCTVHPMLENTSLADFLRVLQSVHTQHSQTQQGGGGAAPTPATPGKTRKLGTAGLQPPQPNSIFNLFPSLRDDKEKDKEKEKEPPRDKPRRMSFWPAVFSTDSNGPAGQATRKLSAMFGGGGGSADLFKDAGRDRDTAALQPKPVKRRRFSIWPTLGTRSDEQQQPSSIAVESGLLAGTGTSNGIATNPQITISYVSDTPSAVPAPAALAAAGAPPPPREALRRIALTKTSALPRASLGDLPVIVASAAGGPVQPPNLGGDLRRRGPSLTSPTPQPDWSAAYRRRALSDATSEQGSRPSRTEDSRDSEDESYDVRL